MLHWIYPFYKQIFTRVVKTIYMNISVITLKYRFYLFVILKISWGFHAKAAFLLSWRPSFPAITPFIALVFLCPITLFDGVIKLPSWYLNTYGAPKFSSSSAVIVHFPCSFPSLQEYSVLLPLESYLSTLPCSWFSFQLPMSIMRPGMIWIPWPSI